MPRKPRITIPGIPHHVTHRGVQQRPIFSTVEDYQAFYRILHAIAPKYQLTILAYCLMTNHVHLVVVPSDESSLSKTVGLVQKSYATYKNAKEGWSGHLWEDRFYSVPLDEHHTLEAIRYVELNPVRAEMCQNPADYQYSSAASHIGLRKDSLLGPYESLPLASEWEEFLSVGLKDREMQLLRHHTQKNIPLGHFTK